MNKRPIVGITMGDPAGNGAEITVKALANPVVYENSRPIVIGDANCMEQAVKIVGQEGKIRIHAVKEVKDACFEYGVIDVYDMGLVDMEKHIFGKVSKMCGEAAFQYVVKVIDLAMKGEIDATVTNALNKEAINMAGHHYSGHTEIYADYTNTSKYTMMLAHDNLRVVHVSTHVSLRQACDLVKKDRVLEVIRIADNACRALGIENPKVGVAGLNPHCGENECLEPKRLRRYSLRLTRRWQREFAYRRKNRLPQILCFLRLWVVGMTSWSLCTMTRDTFH